MKNSRAKSIFYSIVGCTILCIVGLLYMTWAQEKKYGISDSECKELNLVGKYYINDDSESHQLNKNTEFKVDGINTIKFIGNFTEDIAENMLVILRIDNMRVEIKINGKCVYAIGQEETMLEYAHSPGNFWDSFRSKGIRKTDKVEITLTNIYTNHESVVFNKFFGQMYYGYENKLIISNMRAKLINSIFSLFMIFMGIITIVFMIIGYNMKRSIERVAIFSGLCISSGIWFFIDFDVQYYLFPSGVFNNCLDMLGLLFTVFFLLWFYSMNLKTNARYFIVADAICFFITIIVATILQYSGVMDYYETYMAVYVFGLFGIVVTVGVMLWEKRHINDRYLDMLILSSVLLSVGAVADLYGTYYEMIQQIFWFKVAFLLFLFIQFCEIIKAIKKYIAETARVHVLREMAYKDGMTGVQNRTAYLEKLEEINTHIENCNEFAVIVFDINNLKTINDTMGHDKGDSLILSSSILLSMAFGKANLYRIGGDEFVVILSNHDYKKRFKNIQMFVDSCKENNLEIAYGMDVFNVQTDVSYEDVFLKADQAMYQNKKKMKL